MAATRGGVGKGGGDGAAPGSIGFRSRRSPRLRDRLVCRHLIEERGPEEVDQTVLVAAVTKGNRHSSEPGPVPSDGAPNGSMQIRHSRL